MVNSLVERARFFATEHHYGQFRKDGKTPYITHPAAVVGLLRSIDETSEDTLSAAWLHDTIEDCDVTREKLEREFNFEIARIVSALTRDVDREAYKARIKVADYPIQIVKLADMVHNCSDLTGDLPIKTITRKVEDCKSFYFDLAKGICPTFYQLLVDYTRPFMNR